LYFTKRFLSIVNRFSGAIFRGFPSAPPIFGHISDSLFVLLKKHQNYFPDIAPVSVKLS